MPCERGKGTKQIERDGEHERDLIRIIFLFFFSFIPSPPPLPLLLLVDVVRKKNLAPSTSIYNESNQMSLLKGTKFTRKIIRKILIGSAEIVLRWMMAQAEAEAEADEDAVDEKKEKIKTEKIVSKHNNE